MFIETFEEITGPMKNSRLRRAVSGYLLSFILSVILLGSGISSAQTPSAQADKNASQLDSLASSVEQAVVSEKENLESLKQELEVFQVRARDIDREIEGYNAKNAAHSSFLHLNGADIEDFQNIRSEISAALGLMSERLVELKKKRGQLDQTFKKVEDQLVSSQSHLDEIASESPRTMDRENLLAPLRELTRLLKEKQNSTEKLRNLYSDKEARLEDILQAYEALGQEYEQHVQQKRKEDLFQRKFGPLTPSAWRQIQSELLNLGDKVRTVVSVDYWSRQIGTLSESGLESIFPLVLLLAIVQYLVWRLARLLGQLLDRPPGRQHFWWKVSLDVFRGSLPLLGATLFLYSYTLARGFYPGVPIVRLLVQLLILWLFTQWGLRFVKLCISEKKPRALLSLLPSLRLFLMSVRVFGTIYLIAQWFLGSSSTILVLARFLLEVGLVLWCSRFSMRLKWREGQRRRVKNAHASRLEAFVSTLCYTISIGGILMELSGYGFFALYWYTSWGRTAIVLLWAGLLLLSIQGWNRQLKGMASVTSTQKHAESPTLQWLMTRLSVLAWAGLLLMSLSIGWGAGYSFLFKALATLRSPISIGGLSFTLISLVYAFVVLLITHAVTRLSRSFLLTRFLANSGIQAGLQESIVKVTVYTIWVFGILLSLNVLGFSTASMAVGLGALGIGLGFGLQNIFNNFVSGLILLFERPIQVGDALEINGVWGVVRKINVRSTVVQTWDNASLIIPNSEFVSSQVTNWSFQDMRLRRKIEVGVAYGSDVQLVRQTLLEVAENHPRVLKDPAPDVLFIDFSDSALLFRLRIWTTVDVSLSTETDLRFEIDRLFRERKILIPFPQRDVHMYSTVESKKEPAKEEA